MQRLLCNIKKLHINLHSNRENILMIINIIGGKEGTARSVGKVNRPTMFFYLAVAVVGAKISFIKSLSIFMKRETLQKRHKQSNKHVFRVCMHSYMYITKVT